jgi:hypothetical protein
LAKQPYLYILEIVDMAYFFKTRDGHLIKAPPHLPHFSDFFQHYTDAYPTEAASGEASEPMEIPLNEIAGRHLRNIFNFFKCMTSEAPSDYQKALEGEVKEVSEWGS